MILAAVILMLTIPIICFAQGAGGGGMTEAKPPITKNSHGKKKVQKAPTRPRVEKPLVPKKPLYGTFKIKVSRPHSEVVIRAADGVAVFGPAITNIDGTVATASLKRGKYTVTARDNGFIEASVTVDLAGAAQLVRLDLKPVPTGFLNIVTSEADADIEIEGVGRHTGAVRRLELKPGTYRITVKKKGYITRTEELVISTPGTEVNREFNLERIRVGPMLANAWRDLESGNLDRVKDICATILDAEPNNSEAHLLLGQAKFTAGENGSAEQFLTALKGGKLISLPVKIYNESRGEVSLTEAELKIRNDVVRIETPDGKHNFVMLRSNVERVRDLLDKNAQRYVQYEGRGDSSRGAGNLKREIRIYSRQFYLRSNTGKKSVETFCQSINGNSMKCRSDTETISMILASWLNGR